MKECSPLPKRCWVKCGGTESYNHWQESGQQQREKHDGIKEAKRVMEQRQTKADANNDSAR
jgi:hypothetical protein